MFVIASWARFRTLGLWSAVRVRSPAIARRGVICDCGKTHAAASCAMSRLSRHPIDERRSGASASWLTRAGARLVRICANLERRRGAGTNDETVSNKYTTEVASSLLMQPFVGDIDGLRRARRAAKYAVGVFLWFWSRRVSSTADKTIAVYQLSVKYTKQ